VLDRRLEAQSKPPRIAAATARSPLAEGLSTGVLVVVFGDVKRRTVRGAVTDVQQQCAGVGSGFDGGQAGVID
jgi:hypothetical protein